ncbi:hypothetical protein [Sneathiella limimaris]|uniref:hypothetical protein n=1 Tax=Sneathiella limimaris TaxID=1964213 RepID=UPI00146C3151|nr:hypothetical protein [Sneathiella limimaris]
MRNRLREGFLGCVLLVALAGCASRPSEELVQKSQEFSEAVNAVRDAVMTAFDLAETANRLAQQTNLNLQFDLGGRPKVQYVPLFSPKDLSIRKGLFGSLSLYADRLEKSLGAQHLKVAPLDVLDLKEFQVSNSKQSLPGNLLDDPNLSSAVAEVQAIAKHYVSPNTRDQLQQLTFKIQPAIEKLVLFLYLDIGLLGDRKAICKNLTANLKPPVDIDSLPECRGGLRPIMQQALSETGTIWRQRLALSSPKEVRTAKERPALLDKIYSIDRKKDLIDGELTRLQEAVLMLAKLHLSLSREFEGQTSIDRPQPYLKLSQDLPQSINPAAVISALERKLIEHKASLISVLKERDDATE